MSEHAELKPCPFCGCTNVSNKDDGHVEWFECDWCGATSGYDPAPEFEDRGAEWHWNRRAPDATLLARAEKAEKERDEERQARIRLINEKLSGKWRDDLDAERDAALRQYQQDRAAWMEWRRSLLPNPTGTP